MSNPRCSGEFLFPARPLVRDGRFRQVAVQRTPWPSFVIAARDEVLFGRTTEVGRVVDAVIAQAGELMTRPDGAELVSQRYGIALDTAQEWFASTSFAGREAMRLDIASEVLDTLKRAGLR